jgi:hypothetical protein
MARSEVVPVRWWIAAPVLGLAAFLSPVGASYVEEFYSRDFYPWIQRGLTTISNLVGLAFIDVLIVVAVLLVLVRIVRLASAAWTQGIVDPLWEGFRRLVRALGFVLLAFAVMWGGNYRRIPVQQAVGGIAATESIDALQKIIDESNTVATRQRGAGHVNDAITYDEVARDLVDPMNRALEELGRTRLTSPGRPKFSLILTPFFTMAGVNGMLNPFGLESIVHPDLVPIERPFVLAHEWAHLAGHGSEAEASAIGWLACMTGSPTLTYSASVYLIMEAAGRLPDEARRQSLRTLDPAVTADIRLITQRTMRQNPRVQRAATRVYDQYLQANGVEEGVASYGLALQLIAEPPFRSALERQLQVKK